MAPSARDEGGPYQEEDQADSEPLPQPDPSWPRLFSRSPEGDGPDAGDGSDAQQATTGPPVEIGREQISEEMGEDPHRQQEGTGFEPSGEGGFRSSAEEPVAQEPAVQLGLF
jgi:hypothetical protein